MSVLNQIQGGRWDTFLRRLFPIKEKSVAPVLGSELLPMVVVQQWEQELYAIRDERLYSATALRAISGAGTFNFLQISNPAGSKQLVIIEGWIYFDPAAARQYSTFVTPPIATAGDAEVVARDSRFDATRPAADAGEGASVGAVTFTRRVAVFGNIADEGHPEHIPVVLSPGFAFVVQVTAATRAGNFSIWWRERLTEPSELNVG